MSKRSLVIAALALAAGCGSPTQPPPFDSPAPAPAVNPLTEQSTWSGFFRIDTCTAVPAPCYADTVRPQWFTLRTKANGAALEGVFDSEWQQMPVSVTGTLNADGSATFTGNLMTLPPAPVRERLRISRLHVTVSAEAGLSGTLSARMYDGSTRIISATILSAAAEPFALVPERQFQGTWEGFGQVTGCRGECFFYEIGALMPLSLRLTQRGTDVIGEAFDIPAAGGVSGGVLQLSGEMRRTLEAGDIGFTLKRFQAFAVTVDELGRLRGGFTALIRGKRRVSTGVPSAPFEGTIDVALLSVARRY